MAKIDAKNNKQAEDELSYIFPESEKITIDKINLQVQLDKFKSAIIDSFSFDHFINLLITLSAVWIPLFTSNFNAILGISSLNMEAIYVGFAVLTTLFAVYRYVIKSIHFWFTNKYIASTNSEKMVQIILDKCNKK